MIQLESMKIGIEAERANHSQKTGVEHYSTELIQHLAKIDRNNEYVLYLRTPPQDWFKQLPSNFKLKVLPFPMFWTQVRLSWELLLHPVDVLLVPASTLPIYHPKSVYTEHDVAWLYYPEAFTFFMRWFHRIFSWLARFGSSKIIAISQSTKNDLVKHYHVPESKIAVIPHGYTPTSGQDFQLSEKIKQQLPDKYILFLSTLQPRKNLPKLIQAFRLLKQEHPDIPHKLVVVGKPGWRYEESLQAIRENVDIVVYLGHVADQERWPIYKKATAFVHASLYEGFGMWILEAFDCGVPVVISHNSSLPEVGGDAVLYFNPLDVQNIKNTIAKVLLDDTLQQEMVKKGKQQLAKFGWEKCASQTLQVLEQVGASTINNFKNK